MKKEKSLKDFMPNINGIYFKELNNIVSKNFITEEEIIGRRHLDEESQVARDVLPYHLYRSRSIPHSNQHTLCTHTQGLAEGT